MQSDDIELPDQGWISVSSPLGSAFKVIQSTASDRIMLSFDNGRNMLSRSAESWALIIPELVAALPDHLRDDVANAICAAAGEMAS